MSAGIGIICLVTLCVVKVNKIKVYLALGIHIYLSKYVFFELVHNDEKTTKNTHAPC